MQRMQFIRITQEIGNFRLIQRLYVIVLLPIWRGKNERSQIDQKVHNALLLWGLSFIILDIYKCSKVLSYPKIICCKLSQKLLNTNIKTKFAKKHIWYSRPNIQSLSLWSIMKITLQQNYCDVIFNYRKENKLFSFYCCSLRNLKNRNRKLPQKVIRQIGKTFWLKWFKFRLSEKHQN